MLYIALENIRSLYNIGAIFRTCSFFGVYNVILVGYSGKSFDTKGNVVLHAEISKTALGCEKDLDLTFVGNASELLKFACDAGCSLVAVEQHENSISLHEFKFNDDMILVFGNEVDGVSDETLQAVDQIIEIPKKGKHNSLNVTTSVGIVLYSLYVR